MIVLLLIVVVAVIFFIKRKPSEPEHCKCCGKDIVKWKMKNLFGELTQNPFYICDECRDGMSEMIIKSEWSYDDFLAYKKWEQDTKELREKFNPDITYGGNPDTVRIDTANKLFSVHRMLFGPELVFRFKDIADFEFDFNAEELKSGMLGEKADGNEVFSIETRTFKFFGNFSLKPERYKVKKEGILNPKRSIEFSEEYTAFIKAFSDLYLEEMMEEYNAAQNNPEMDELAKSMALFMIDDMTGITEEKLKKQRNTLIKAFHPDNSEVNDSYSQKINAAYEVLKKNIAM